MPPLTIACFYQLQILELYKSFKIRIAHIWEYNMILLYTVWWLALIKLYYVLEIY